MPARLRAAQWSRDRLDHYKIGNIELLRRGEGKESQVRSNVRVNVNKSMMNTFCVQRA